MFFCRFLTETAGDVIFADVLLLPNGMSKVGANVSRGWLSFLFLFFTFSLCSSGFSFPLSLPFGYLCMDCWVDGLGLAVWTL